MTLAYENFPRSITNGEILDCDIVGYAFDKSILPELPNGQFYLILAKQIQPDFLQQEKEILEKINGIDDYDALAIMTHLQIQRLLREATLLRCRVVRQVSIES